MTPDARDAFDRDGVACLRGAVDPEIARRICDRVWSCAAEEMGVLRDDPTTWRRVRPAIVKRLREDEGLFDPILGPVVAEALGSLLGGGWSEPKAPGQLLMTPPDGREWTVPSKMWHMDSPAPGWVRGLPGVQVFLVLDRVEHGGGATLVAGGSHRLVAGLPERESPAWDGRSADVRRALRRSVPWVRALVDDDGPPAERIARFAERTTQHEGVPLRVIELTGGPGDVYLMHPWMLHAPSTNVGARMRIVATERLTARGVVLYGSRRA